MSVPDWYPDPGGSANLRYFDGNEWTDHYSPLTEAALTERLNAAVAQQVSAGGRVELQTARQVVISHGGQTAGVHVLLGILTLFTCGLFAIVWAIYAIAAKPWRITLTVMPNGEVIHQN